MEQVSNEGLAVLSTYLLYAHGNENKVVYLGMQLREMELGFVFGSGCLSIDTRR